MDGLYRASEFAALTGVTVRALHHYDRLGLVRPTGRTAAGYRLYGARDFARLQQVLVLKFIGLPLREIKSLLEGQELDLPATLRLQREVLESRRRQLDLALRAVAEALAARGGGPDWEAFKKIVEVITMQQDYEWMKKYYTEEQLADLARRGTPEVLGRGQRDWQALIKEVEQGPGRGRGPRGRAGAGARRALDGARRGVHGRRPRHPPEPRPPLRRPGELARHLPEALPRRGRRLHLPRPGGRTKISLWAKRPGPRGSKGSARAAPAF